MDKKIKEAVMIKVFSEQTDMEDAKETMELITEGQGWMEGERLFLTYDESEVTGMEGTKTTMEIFPDRLIVNREGTVNLVQEFAEGEERETDYETTYGNLILQTNTKRLKVSGHGIYKKVDLEYELCLNAAEAFKNILTVEVIPEGNVPSGHKIIAGIRENKPFPS